MERKTLALRGIRRKIIVGACLAVFIAAIALPILSSGAVTVPSADYHDYVLYSYTTISLKPGAVINGNMAAGTTHYAVPSGCTGVPAFNPNEYTTASDWLKNTSCTPNGYPAATGSEHIHLCNGPDSQRTTVIPSPYYVVAPSTDVNYSTVNCQVAKVYTLDNSPNISPIANVTNSFGAPNITLPTLPAAGSCTSPLAVPRSAATTPLAPGSYTTGTGLSALVLGAGPYTFCGNFTIVQGGTLKDQANTVVNVTGNLAFQGGANSPVGTDPNAQFNIAGSSDFGRNGVIQGTFLLPNGSATLGNSTMFTGHVWAYVMHSDFSVTFNAPPPTTTTTVPTKTPTTGPRGSTAPPTTTPPTSVPPTTTPPTTTAPTTTTTFGF